MRPPAERLAAALAVSASILVHAGLARGFVHVVRPGETLAGIAQRIYGRVEFEKLLVTANTLDAHGGSPIVPGLRLEVPALEHHRVQAGDTWPRLADRLLGDPARADVLALANDTMPWLPPADGQEIVVPYNLLHIARPGDTLSSLAYRYLGDRDRAWTLDRYNARKGAALRPGDPVLVPLTELPLTSEGRAEAAVAGALVRSQGAGQAREVQRRVAAELPGLAAAVRQGRYVEAVAHGGKLLALGELARPQLAQVHRLLTEAYVALEATGLAETSCAAWQEADGDAALDPDLLSPKVLRACLREGR